MGVFNGSTLSVQYSTDLVRGADHDSNSRLRTRAEADKLETSVPEREALSEAEREELSFKSWESFLCFALPPGGVCLLKN